MRTLTIGTGTAVHILDEEYGDKGVPVCRGTRNARHQAKRIGEATPTCKACLKRNAK